MMEPVQIADYACVCGEGPLWHEEEQCLYWVDIPRGRLFRYTPDTGQHEQLFEGPALGGFTIQKDGGLLLFMERGAIKYWKDGVFSTLFEELPEERETRFNDVIADPAGRVFCGTMPTAERLGRLYRLDPDGSISLLLEDIGCSNGMGFSPDQTVFYYTDSPKRHIYAFDYDVTSGAIRNQRIFAELPEGEGCPDGMTVDREGYVWSAIWDGSCLVRFRPDGTEEQRVLFPAKKVSSCIFGGHDYGDLYVTTAGGDHREEEGAGAGALFRVRPPVGGTAEFRSTVAIQ